MYPNQLSKMVCDLIVFIIINQNDALIIGMDCGGEN